MNRGFLFVAMGDEHSKLFQNAHRHLRESGNIHLPVTVISDKLEESTDYQVIKMTENGYGAGSRNIKVGMDSLTPYDETVFLDTDLVIINNIENLFDYVQGDRGIAMCRDDECTLGQRLNITQSWLPGYLGREEMAYMQQFSKNLDYYNSGVIVWRKGTTFFSQWREEWKRFQRIDQFALARTVAASPNILLELPKVYNWSYSKVKDLAGAKSQGVRILHFWLGMWKRSGWWSNLFAV